MEFKNHLVLLHNAFEGNNITELKRLSEEFAGDAFISDSKENIELSIVAYSCAKFLEKPYVVRSAAWPEFQRNMLSLMDEALEDLNEGRKQKAYASLAKSVSLIEGLSDELGRFVLGIIEKARLKAGTEIYAHGASLGTATALSGAQKRELAAYISATKMPEKYVTKSVSQRMQDVRKIFS